MQWSISTLNAGKTSTLVIKYHIFGVKIELKQNSTNAQILGLRECKKDCSSAPSLSWNIIQDYHRPSARSPLGGTDVRLLHYDMFAGFVKNKTGGFLILSTDRHVISILLPFPHTMYLM